MGIDVVEMVVGERTRYVLRIIAGLLGLLFCAVMLIATWIQFHDAWAGELETLQRLGAAALGAARLPCPSALPCCACNMSRRFLTLLTAPAVPAAMGHWRGRNRVRPLAPTVIHRRSFSEPDCLWN